MKKLLLSTSLIALGSTISFSQQQENTENTPEVKKVQVEAVKAKEVKKTPKVESVKIQAVQSKRTTPKETTELKGKKEN